MAISLGAKIAISTVRSKPVRKILGFILGVIGLFLFMIFAVVMSALSIFSADGKIDKNFNAQETAVYQTIRSMYAEYTKADIQDMYDLAEEYRLKNMVQETKIIEVYNAQKKKMEKKEVTEEYCKAEFIIENYKYISTSYVLAYLTCKHNKDYIRKNVKIDKDEVIAFWNHVNSGAVLHKTGSDDAPTYEIYNTVQSLNDIAEYYFETPEARKEFLSTVFLISRYVGAEHFERNVESRVQLANRKMDIPLYYQHTGAWAKKSYGKATIAKSGCAPTCIAMVFSYLTGNDVYPDDIVEFTGNKYYVSGQGSSWQIFGACAEQWNIGCTAIGADSDAVAEALVAGKPVILSVGPGMFTNSGHFIVLTGIDTAAMVTVNDPNDNSRKNFKNMKFDLEQIMREAKGGWCFG